MELAHLPKPGEGEVRGLGLQREGIFIGRYLVSKCLPYLIDRDAQTLGESPVLSWGANSLTVNSETETGSRFLPAVQEDVKSHARSAGSYVECGEEKRSGTERGFSRSPLLPASVPGGCVCGVWSSLNTCLCRPCGSPTLLGKIHEFKINPTES